MLEGIKNLLSKVKKNPSQVVVHEHLDPDSVKDNHTIQNLRNQNADLQGELSRYKSEEGLDREREKDYDEEDEIKKQLKEEQKEIDREGFGTYFSLIQFFSKLLKDKKFRENLVFTTWDRQKVIGKFGDIGLSRRGFTLFDNTGKIIIADQKPADIFQSISALGNDVQALRIPLNMDEKGRYIENFMEYKPAESYLVDGKIYYKASSKKAMYDLITEKNETIGEQAEEIAEHEETIQKQTDKINELNTANKISLNSAEISRNEKSKMVESSSEIEKAMTPVAKELSIMYKVHEIDEDNISKLERQLKIISKEAEEIGSKPSFDNAMQKIENIMGVIKKNRMIPKEKEKSKPPIK